MSHACHTRSALLPLFCLYSGTHAGKCPEDADYAWQERANIRWTPDPGGFGLSAAVRYHFRRSGPIRRQCQRVRNARMAPPPGAPAARRTAQRVLSPGRFAAEWCTRRARVRRKSLLLRGRSGRRCDGSQGNPRSQCAVGRAYCDLRESYKMTAGPGSRGKVRACVPPTRERVHEISRHADVQPESGKSVVFGQS